MAEVMAALDVHKFLFANQLISSKSSTEKIENLIDGGVNEIAEDVEEVISSEGKQVQTFVNNTKDIIEIYIEINPDLYLLKPNDEMKIFYDPDKDGSGLYTILTEYGGLQVYLEHFETTIVTINGQVVEPWSSQVQGV